MIKVSDMVAITEEEKRKERQFKAAMSLLLREYNLTDHELNIKTTSGGIAWIRIAKTIQ
jgi:hypothetical protein